MKDLRTYILENNIQNDWNSLVLEEYSGIVGTQMINESFKSSILQKLAKTIIQYQKGYVQRKKDVEARGGSMSDPKSFTSIFGPTLVSRGTRYSMKQRMRGVKWNEIDDSEFQTFNGWDKPFLKLMKEVYGHKMNALIIACDPDTDDIIYVIRGIDDSNPPMWKFKDDPNNADPNKRQTFLNVQVNNRKGSYITGSPNLKNAIELVNDYVIHFLEITDSMKQDYNVLVTDRDNAKKDMTQLTTGYTKEQLKRLSETANAKLRALARTAKAMKVISGDIDFMSRINKIHDEAMELYHQCISNEQYLIDNYSVGNLMSYMSDIFSTYYEVLRSRNELKIRKKRYDEEHPEMSDDEANDKLINSYTFGTVESSIKNLESSMKRIEQEIAAIRKRLEPKE